MKARRPVEGAGLQPTTARSGRPWRWSGKGAVGVDVRGPGTVEVRVACFIATGAVQIRIGLASRAGGNATAVQAGYEARAIQVRVDGAFNQAITVADAGRQAVPVADAGAIRVGVTVADMRAFGKAVAIADASAFAEASNLPWRAPSVKALRWSFTRYV
jgi:hypothetical protein